MQSIKFEDKWKLISEKSSDDEFSLFVPKGMKPRTQRQINFFWYYKFFENLIKDKNYKNGLELGCGRGTMSLFLNKYDGIEVALLDISEDAIKLAKENFSKYDARAEFFVGSSDSIPMPDSSVDIVYSIGLLEHIDNYDVTIKEGYRVLKLGGVMIHLNIPEKWSAQNINNLYKWFLRLLSGKFYPPKDYYRNNDTPEDYIEKVKNMGFKKVYAVNVNPFPIFVPISMKTDKAIAKLYNFTLWIRKIFLKYPFKTNYTLSQGHFLVGYK
ncbi:MAG: hypothetical protein COU51_03980 [Parcubacteria group bacterium CG10_big_fil_rev_8_21_14_0_10_36_14]|nr:MAG: hypothetical protein COU51_03980 [Parcubacteria group bacterium CG10_big_fil_rev_8_21_14_0_10_36_14]